MDRLRMDIAQTSPFGRQLIQALALSTTQTLEGGKRKVLLCANRSPGRRYLRDFTTTLHQVRDASRNFYPQFDDLAVELHGGAQAMLVVYDRGNLHVMCSTDPEEFNRLLDSPDDVDEILRTFKAPSSRYTYGNVS